MMLWHFSTFSMYVTLIAAGLSADGPMAFPYP